MFVENPDAQCKNSLEPQPPGRNGKLPESRPKARRARLRVLIYSANFWPEPVGIGKYSGEMAHWLAAQGHEVRVVAAPPYYPNWKVQDGYRWPLYQREEHPGMTILRAPLWVPKSPGGLSRILHLVSFAITSLPVILCQMFWRPQIVLTVAPALVCAPAGWLVARLSGAKAWLHIQDFEVDVAFNMGLLKSSLLQRVALGLERWLLRRFDSVSSISRRMVSRLIAKGVPEERTRYFPNWVDISHVNPSSNGKSYRNELGASDDAVVVLYSGTLGAKQGLQIIPEVATLLAARRDILFVICGDGALKEELEARTRDLPNVRLLPLQPFERLGDLLTTANIHLLPQSSNAADLVLPSKLTGMLASGRPVVATCAPDTELASVVSLCGMITAPGNPEHLANVVVNLADNRQLMKELGARARAWAEEHLERDLVLGRMFALSQDAVTPVPVANAQLGVPVTATATQPSVSHEVANHLEIP
jgi:colanic acid biosynthesis glycosyl transferase WcaI